MNNDKMKTDNEKTELPPWWLVGILAVLVLVGVLRNAPEALHDRWYVVVTYLMLFVVVPLAWILYAQLGLSNPAREKHTRLVLWYVVVTYFLSACVGGVIEGVLDALSLPPPP